MDTAYVDPLRGAPVYVDSLTWSLLVWTPLRGARYVDSLTWTLLTWTTLGGSYVDPSYVDP